VDSFLAESGLRRGDIEHWIAHTGGPKVLLAMESALEVPRCSLDSLHTTHGCKECWPCTATATRWCSMFAEN
jgi:predicted naringenin-chalcone synthase